MRREAMKHRWPVNSPDAYPVVARRDPGGIPRPLGGRDVVETVAAATLALSAFLPKHAAIFKADTFAPVCESYLRRRGPRGSLHRPRRGVRPLRHRRLRRSGPRRLTIGSGGSLRRHRRNGGSAPASIATPAGLTPRADSSGAPAPLSSGTGGVSARPGPPDSRDFRAPLSSRAVAFGSGHRS